MKLKSRSKSSRKKKLSRRASRRKVKKTRSRPKKARKPKKARVKKKNVRMKRKKAKMKRAAPRKLRKTLRKRKPKRVFKAKPVKRTKKLKKLVRVREVKIDKLELEKLKQIHGLLSDSVVRQMLIDIGGENALAIIRNFQGKLSDEELAKALKLKISDVRATLNRLHNEGFVKYIRQKDSETGWYSYSWVLNHERLEKWANEQAKGIITLEGNGNQYYFCKACGVATLTDFVTASDLGFRCERCNKSLEFLDEKAVAEFNISFTENNGKELRTLLSKE